jgi:hypothetical protein
MIAGDPGQGGATWAVLQYVLGLRNLRHDVFLIEPVAAKSIRPDGASLEASTNARYFHDVVKRFKLEGRAALLRQETQETIGLRYDELMRTAASTDLLINISGMLTDSPLFDAIDARVYLDLDPAFNQLWHAVEGVDIRLDGHTHYVTVGTAIGTAACKIPTCGRSWLATLQPIVLGEWPMTRGNADAPWTTVGNWRGYGSIEYEGVLFGQKAHSLRRFLSVPRRTADRFVLALAIHAGEVSDLNALAEHGWCLADPAAVAGTPDDYQAFIQRSKGEFGIAKSGYVAAQCGWFSDRSVCYLASGRPVLAQDTGFDGVLPTGEGLIAFSTEDEVIAGIEAINSDYTRHAKAARNLAVEYFEADRVLRRLLTAVCG